MEWVNNELRMYISRVQEINVGLRKMKNNDTSIYTYTYTHTCVYNMPDGF